MKAAIAPKMVARKIGAVGRTLSVETKVDMVVILTVLTMIELLGVVVVVVKIVNNVGDSRSMALVLISAFFDRTLCVHGTASGLAGRKRPSRPNASLCMRLCTASPIRAICIAILASHSMPGIDS
jgi:hypothetical protein